MTCLQCCPEIWAGNRLPVTAEDMIISDEMERNVIIVQKSTGSHVSVSSFLSLALSLGVRGGKFTDGCRSIKKKNVTACELAEVY